MHSTFWWFTDKSPLFSVLLVRQRFKQIDLFRGGGAGAQLCFLITGLVVVLTAK